MISSKNLRRKQWKSRNKPQPEQLLDLRLHGWKNSQGKCGPNFFDWFKDECMKMTMINNGMHQISFGFRRVVTRYGCYDVNGYRFCSEKYESNKSRLTTVNSGVCVSCVDDKNNELEYYGVIKDIIKIKWEGSVHLE